MYMLERCLGRLYTVSDARTDVGQVEALQEEVSNYEHLVKQQRAELLVRACCPLTPMLTNDMVIIALLKLN